MNDDKKYQVMPDLTDEEYAELKADINARGVQVPIEFDQDGNCLDGHHRLKICQELGITDYPTVTKIFHSEDEKIEHALLENLARRHLTTDQKREVIQWIFKNHDMENAEIARLVCISKDIVIEERQKWSAIENRHLTISKGTDGKQYPASADQAQAQRDSILDELTEHPEKSDRQIARETGASHVTVGNQRKKMVSIYNPSNRDREALRDPDIQRRLAENEGMNVAGAIREQTRDNLIEHLESVETKEAKAVRGVYDVIVIDPPWPMARIETDANPHATAMDYPTMSLEEIEALEIPAADDCHVFLWTTQKYLPSAFNVFEAWGVKYVCCFVWHKNHGHKPFGLPKYNCEFVLYGHIGSPTFVHEDQFWACFEAPITEHSEKPEKFYDMIRHVTAGRRLDMFNRRKIDGFDVWGKEAAGDEE